MKNVSFALLFALLLLSGLYAESSGDNPVSDPEIEIPVIKNKPFIIFNEGVTASWITRIIKKETRSNFVFTDFMPGIYLGIKTVNMQPLNSIVRLAAYYPLSFKFNDGPQVPKNVIRYAIDLFAGVAIELNMWEYVRINLAPGLHFLFQNSDRWNYMSLGLGGLAGVELPVAKRWTLLVNGIASIDNGNLGSNKTMEPYDIVYQYQLDVGIRYSRKGENKYSYIKK
ncbi:MAG: hypothetical protein LBR47_00535 [Spirochaetaceae bacterium]|jgi:hypothetical protein|nr:hypothetical protein [Spirochaetaceae bacterium]